MPVVDASVAIDWVAPDSSAASSSVRLLRRLGSQRAEVFAPRLLVEEISNALISGIRRRRWTGAQADASHDLLLRLPVRIVDDRRDLLRAWELARRYDNHPIYDMIYLALAERGGWDLITADLSLRRRLGHLSWVMGPEAAP